MVTELTQLNNTLALVIMAQDNLVSKVGIGGHFLSCEHKMVHIAIRIYARVTVKKMLVPNIKRANFASQRIINRHSSFGLH